MKDCKGHNCQHADPEQHSAECIAEHQCSYTGIEPIEVVTYFASMIGLTTEQMVKWAANGKAKTAKLAGAAPHIADRTGMHWWDVVCAMPRYSFWRGEQGDGIVNRVPDPTGNWVEVSVVEAMVGAIDIAFRQHESDCSTNNRGVPELLGPCDCSVSQAKQHVVELTTMSILGQFPADQRETAANVLLMCKRAVLDSGAAVKMGAWTEGDAAVAELVQEAMQDVAGGKTYTHEEAKQLMAERRAKVEASKTTCTDERPCVNCFSGQGECEVGPFGGPELLEQARALCQAIERLPAGEHQTNLISKVADATFALQNLQSTGDYFWPRPVAPSLLDTSRISAEDLEALKAKLMSLRDNGGIMTPVLAAPMLTQAAQSVLAERRRQVEVEGRTPESDDQYAGGQLAFAAIAYLMVGVNPNGAAQWWPWDAKTFKPSPDTRRNLVKAGALLLADIEWVDRRQAAATPVPDDLTQFLEQTDFDAAEKVASEKADDNQTNDSDKR